MIARCPVEKVLHLIRLAVNPRRVRAEFKCAARKPANVTAQQEHNELVSAIMSWGT